MSDERDPQAHRIMELRREVDELRATVARVEALAAGLASSRGGWDADVAALIRHALDGDVDRLAGSPTFGTVPGDGWAAPETEADHPLRLVTGEESTEQLRRALDGDT